MNRRIITESLKFTTGAVVVITGVILWWLHYAKSPMTDPNLAREYRYVVNYLRENAPDHNREKELAEAYWKRYPDVRDHPFYGVSGPTGTHGAHDHFRQHGKREGRVMAPLPTPAEPNRERRLAKSYWNRYPDVAGSTTWGRNGPLGFLGPRDHYQNRGKKEGRVWGEETTR